MKISAFTILSEPERLKYPYIESIKSFLPIADEIIVVCNYLDEFRDGSDEIVKQIDPKVKVIYGLFDYKRFGWASQGLMRTNGYYAATGDIVLMFDADGVLHENDIERTRGDLERILNEQIPYGFWMKHHFFKTEYCWRQCKHSGIYNKSLIGNKFNFYGHKGYYAPNWELLGEVARGRQIDTYIFGYEHLWEDKDLFFQKLHNSYIMQKSVKPDLDEEEFKKSFFENLKEKKAEVTTEFISLDKHPRVIQDKLKEINIDMWGYNNFGM